MSNTKRCTGCGETKPHNEYHRNRTAPDGLQAQCKECAKQYQEANRERLNEYHHRYYRNNRDRLREYHRNYREANREQVRETERRWREANKEKVAEKQRRYYAENKEQIRERRRQHYAKNRETILERHRQHREENREEYRRRVAKYVRATQAATSAVATRAGKPWTPEDDAVLTADDGRTIREKALELHRTYHACATRRSRLERGGPGA